MPKNYNLILGITADASREDVKVAFRRRALELHLERLECLTVEVLLGQDEAAYGGQVRVWIPARATCRACGGLGSVGLYECWRCEGQGALTTDFPLDLAYPSGLRDGYAVRIPLTRFGIENLYLTVLFRVSVN